MHRAFIIILLTAATVPAAELTTTDGAVLHFAVFGKGDPVIVLSGGPGFASAYLTPIARHIGVAHRAVLVDQRGTGSSTVPAYDTKTITVAAFVADLEALREKLGAPRVTLVGHSWGGMLAMSYAAAHPDRVAAMVLVDSGGPTPDFMLPFVMRLNARNAPDDLATINYWNDPAHRKESPLRAVLEITRARTPAYFHDRAKARALTDNMNERSFEPRVLELMLKSLEGWNVTEAMKKLSAPVLIIEGDDDPVGTFQLLRDSFPSPRAAMIAGAGHFPWLEEPDQFWAAIDPFLSRVATPARH